MNEQQAKRLRRAQRDFVLTEFKKDNPMHKPGEHAAKLYVVSCAYAAGVSAGFESSLVSDSHSLGYGSYAEGDDAARGLAVGRAAFVALCLSEEGASS